ncbi:galectin-12 isoform X2 [Phascolarctos cinereus]|uniref:Galectin n=1 Tax=Phascolarctos cinereus TaxID=38626 RepID=A0A6P5IZM1_PHACI|nr:galectin-12 isoform X2 [Phascolarctos cinereus]
MVVVQGVVPPDAQRFQIDFQCGCSLQPRPDIAVHFNPRFYTTKPHVICNTLHRGRWQWEARWPELALGKGDGFLILFLFGNEHVKPFVEGGTEYPAGHPFLLKSSRLAVPCTWPLPRGLWPGQVFVVRGLICPNPQEFTLSLRDDSTHPTVTLKVCFRNRTLAWISPWGRKEPISAPFLFHPQRFFEVLLLRRDNDLKMALNGNAVGAASLGQRALGRLREIRISGSVELYCVWC